MYTFHVPVADDGEAMAQSIERAIQWRREHAGRFNGEPIHWEFHIITNENGNTA